MNSEKEKYEVKYCADDDQYGVYLEICDKLCIERYYESLLKSGTHTNNFYTRQDSIIFNFSLTEPKQ